MANDTEQLVVSLEARIRDFERNMAKANRAANDNFGKIENRARQSAQRMQQAMLQSSTSVASSLKGMAGAIAAAVTGNRIVALTDSYTRFTNQLKVAGLEGSALADTQNRLFAIAQKYGVQLEAVGTLYGRNAASAKEMGLSQEDQLRIVEASSAALKVSGQSASEAAGALLQLSQALGGTNIQAEEYNSLLDGARPLLQAVASGSDRWSGSVAKLTADVKAGKVATRDFVQALLAGANGTIAQAGQATLTTSSAVETLSNALAKYFGEADKSNGATAALAEAIETLADNLDTVIPALAVISTALGVGFVTNLGMAARATRGLGGALLGAFGGPVGIAITGVTVALAALYTEGQKTQAVMDSVDAIVADAAKALADAKGKADSAATGVKGVGTEAAQSEVKVRKFAGTVGEAAQELYNLAKARQAAFISDLEAKRQQASLAYSALSQRTDEAVQRNMNTPYQGIGTFLSAVGTRAKRLLGIGETDAEVKAQQEKLKGAMAEYDAAIRYAARNLERFAPPATPAAKSSPAATTKASGTSRASEADKAAKAEEELDKRVKETAEDLRLQIRLDALRAQGFDYEADRQQAIADIHRQFPELVDTTNGKLKERLALLEQLAVASVDQRYEEEDYQRQLDNAKQVFAARKQAREQAMEQERQAEQEQVNSLADFYYSAFSGGNASLWADFKEQGLRAIAQLAARFTLSLMDGKPGNLFSNGIGTALNSVLGFSSGGYTGAGGKYEPAGVVHRGEYVLNQDATRKIGVRTLDAMNAGRIPGFASGGYVGRSITPSRSTAPSAGSISIANDITISIEQAAGGSIDASQAKAVGAALKAETARFMESWVHNEMRPGGRLAAARR